MALRAGLHTGILTSLLGVVCIITYVNLTWWDGPHKGFQLLFGKQNGNLTVSTISAAASIQEEGFAGDNSVFAGNLREYPSFSFADDESRGNSVKQFPVQDLHDARNGLVYDIFLYRVIRVPYDLNFPGVIKTGSAGPRRWAFRIMSYFQEKNASGFAEWGFSCSPAWRNFKISIDAQLNRPSSPLGGPWSAECSSSLEATTSSTLFLECPMPEESWSDIENVSNDTTLEMNLYYQAVVWDHKKPLANVSMIVERSVGSGHNLAMCIGPLYGDFKWEKWVEYIEYHRLAIGVEHFFLYSYVDVGVKDDARDKLIQHYKTQGLLTYVAWRRRHELNVTYPSSFPHRAYAEQPIMYNDCLVRNKFSFKWLGFLDFDEYILA